MPLSFVACDLPALESLTIDGQAAIATLAASALEPLFDRYGLPRASLRDEKQQRMLLGALSVAAASSGVSVHMNTWSELRDEARGLLLLGIRRDGRISASTAEALTVLNKPAVVERYRIMGNRWTIAESCRDAQTPAAAERAVVERARRALGGGDATLSTGEWLTGLAAAIDAPVDERPWWASKLVLVVVSLAALFILVHVALLLRVMLKVHAADSKVLLLPIAGLSASAVVGAFAIGVHVMTGSGEPRAKQS